MSAHRPKVVTHVASFGRTFDHFNTNRDMAPEWRGEECHMKENLLRGFNAPDGWAQRTCPSDLRRYLGKDKNWPHGIEKEVTLVEAAFLLPQDAERNPPQDAKYRHVRYCLLDQGSVFFTMLVYHEQHQCRVFGGLLEDSRVRECSTTWFLRILTSAELAGIRPLWSNHLAMLERRKLRQPALEEHGLDDVAVEKKTAALLKEHGLDQQSIKVQREQLFERLGI
jgi:hypothetical protein